MSDAFYLDAEPYKGGDGGFFLDAEPYQPAGEPRKLGSRGESLAGGFTSLLKGLTFGAGDEIAAGGNAALDAVFGGPGYDSRLKQARALSDAYDRENPVSGTLNSLAGLFAPTPNVMSKVKGVKAALGNIGKGAAVGAAYGGGSGFLGGEGGASERLESATTGAKYGAALGGGLSTVSEGVQGVAGKMARAVPQLERKSVGARQSDYAKTAKDIGIIDAGDGLETTTKAALDDLLLNNKLGSSRDPQTILAVASAKEKELAGQVGALISQADKQAAKPVIPTWERALEMVESGQIPGEKIGDYLKRLEQIDNAIQSKGKGKLSYIQQQKVALGKMWDPNDSVLNEFNRALYYDLQKSVESVVPEVSVLNRELSKYKVVKPILQRALAAGENENPLDKVISAIKTTGGYGTLIGGATMAAGPAGFAGGLTTAAALRYLRSPQGQKFLANTYKGASPLVEGAGSGIANSLPGVVGATQSKPSSSQDKQGKGQPEQSSSKNSPLFAPSTQAKSQQSSNPPLPKSLFGGRKDGIADYLFGATAKNARSESKKNVTAERLGQYGPPEVQAEMERGVIQLMQRGYSEAEAKKIVGAEAIKRYGGDMSLKHETTVAKVMPHLFKQESSNNPKAVGPKTKYGTAKGLGQLLDSTGREWHEKLGLPGKYDPFNEEQNATISAAYYDWLLGQVGGDAKLALAAYNYGIGNIKRKMKTWGNNFKSIYPRLPLKTQQYVMKISKNAGIA